VLGGVLLRLVAAFWFDAHTQPTGDAPWYLDTAQLFAQGHGFVEPLRWFGLHTRQETAGHPPASTLFNSALDVLGIHWSLYHRIWGLLPGAVSIAMAGLIGRAVASGRGGLGAAAAAAVSIPLIVHDVDLWSEGLYLAFLLTAVWAAVLLGQRPSLARAAGLGLAVGATALTRAEGILLVVLVVAVPCTVAAARGRRTALVAIGVVAMIVPIVPWFAYNTTRFEHPVVLSTGMGYLLWSSNCRATYSGWNLGGWGYLCAGGHHHLSDDESTADLQTRRIGLDYARAHADRLPVVVLARVARTFGLWRPRQVADESLFLRDAGLGGLTWVAVVQFWLYAVLAGFGIVELAHRHRRVLLPLLVPIGITVFITVTAYGSVRFRASADAVAPVLAAVGAASVAARRSARRAVPAGTAPVGAA
jgi:hypothetical protein